MAYIREFLISMLLWHLTWGWKHVLINMCIMPFSLRWIVHCSWRQAVMLTGVSHLCVSGLYIIFGSILAHTYNYAFHDANAIYLQIYNAPFICALTFAVLYAVLQLLFFMCVYAWYPTSFSRIICALLISNTISAYIISLQV